MPTPYVELDLYNSSNAARGACHHRQDLKWSEAVYIHMHDYLKGFMMTGSSGAASLSFSSKYTLHGALLTVAQPVGGRTHHVQKPPSFCLLVFWSP